MNFFFLNSQFIALPLQSQLFHHQRVLRMIDPLDKQLHRNAFAYMLVMPFKRAEIADQSIQSALLLSADQIELFLRVVRTVVGIEG